MRAMPPPLIVSGLGGSGTRVVAQILIDAGVYMGRDLNVSLDDLSFTMLLKHPYWYRDTFDSPQVDLGPVLDLHRSLLFGRKPRVREIPTFLRRAYMAGTRRYGLAWAAVRIAGARPRSELRRLEGDPWGWKEPHALFHLRGLATHYPNAKLIWLTRSGLDLAFSSQDQQQLNWGRCFSCSETDLSPRSRFEFWYRANTYAISMGKKLFGGGFHLVALEHLWQEPDPTVMSLVDFSGVYDPTKIQELASLPKRPRSTGRFRDHSQDWIDDRVIQQSEELGYGPDGLPIPRKVADS